MAAVEIAKAAKKEVENAENGLVGVVKEITYDDEWPSIFSLCVGPILDSSLPPPLPKLTRNEEDPYNIERKGTGSIRKLKYGRFIPEKFIKYHSGVTIVKFLDCDTRQKQFWKIRVERNGDKFLAGYDGVPVRQVNIKLIEE